MIPFKKFHKTYIICLFQAFGKKLQLKHFTLAMPLLDLELQGEILTLPANLCQIVVKVK